MTASPLRRFQNRILRERVVPLASRTVLNVGSMPHEQDREGRLYRDYFPGAEYRTLNKRAGADIVADAHFLTPLLGQYDLLLLMNVLEHVERPSLVAEGICGLLGQSGHLFVAVPFLYPLHPGRDFGDFWRFTPGGLALLFLELHLEWIEAAPADSGYCALFKEPS